VRGVLTALAALALGLGVRQEPAAVPESHARLAAAARAVIESLTPEQRAAALFAADAPQRHDWHFIPRARPGLLLKDMTAEQRARTEALLRAALGAHGAEQVTTVRELDDVLRWMVERGGGKAEHRDSLLYALAIFGEPDPRAPWAFRFEGHHVSVTVSCDGQGGIAFSPFFLGAAPALVRDGPRAGLRALAAEQDLGLELFAGLSDEQRARAYLGRDVPNDVLIAPGAELRRLEPAGLPDSELDPAQRLALARLVAAYLEDTEPALREPGLAEPGEAHFAWAGGGERDALHYYRVQTARIVIEFVTTQGDVNHVHAYWRDFERDLTRDWMLRHIASESVR
jgi:hypothetical protein